MAIITKTFEELEPGDVLILPELLNPSIEVEYTVEEIYSDRTIKLKELGGVVVKKLAEYKVKVEEHD